mmetsp:Transcript_33361/g.72166  ORF Transcript_33361/g.72166 Transcript_33361/m.72166 type:complete len:203 (-) Transcript_33361:899-1507(-)
MPSSRRPLSPTMEGAVAAAARARVRSMPQRQIRQRHRYNHSPIPTWTTFTSTPTNPIRPSSLARTADATLPFGVPTSISKTGSRTSIQAIDSFTEMVIRPNRAANLGGDLATICKRPSRHWGGRTSCRALQSVRILPIVWSLPDTHRVVPLPLFLRLCSTVSCPPSLRSVSPPPSILAANGSHRNACTGTSIPRSRCGKMTT